MACQLILKSTHLALPIKIRVANGDFEWEYSFSFTDCEYELKNGDQLDWNKLTGVTGRYTDRMKDSQMIGWRYNIESKVFELNFYGHVNRERFMGPVIASISSSRDVFNVKIKRVSGAVSLTLIHNDIEYESVPVTYIYRKMFLIDGWFGGNQCAPRTISYEQNKLK